MTVLLFRLKYVKWKQETGEIKEQVQWRRCYIRSKGTYYIDKNQEIDHVKCKSETVL
jgi:hypothetical protein